MTASPWVYKRIVEFRYQVLLFICERTWGYSPYDSVALQCALLRFVGMMNLHGDLEQRTSDESLVLKVEVVLRGCSKENFCVCV